MRLSATAMNPVGLAYDSASRRFVVGDGDGNKLMVADEVFDHVNDLIGAASAGFGRLSAVEIDTRRGDLWVTSSDGNGAASIHKLQLVSGRVLSQIAVPTELQPIVLSDFAVIRRRHARPRRLTRGAAAARQDRRRPVRTARFALHVRRHRASLPPTA